MLTAKQKQAYEFIREYILKQNIAPTDAEIAQGLGIKSRGVAHRYVSALADKGYITLTPNRSRNIQLVAEQNSPFDLPIIGAIAAGQPIEAMDQHRSLNLADHVLGPNRFLLVVKGDSMIGDNICDGDYVICEKAEVVNRHQIAVVLVDNSDATLKRVKNNNDGSITLIPSNPTLKPQMYPAEQVKIQGIFIGLLRLTG